MEPNIEGQVPQKTPEGGVPQTPTVTLTQAELDDLKHRAEVSSQNYARVKKLEEENERIRAENELLEINTATLAPSDPRVSQLESKLSEVQAQLNKKEVIERYPVLKDLWNDLESYRAEPENKGMNLNTAAKSFMLEKGLLEPTRSGIEKATGGQHAPIMSGMTSEEVENLRKTDYRKYTDMLMKGQIKIT